MDFQFFLFEYVRLICQGNRNYWKFEYINCAFTNNNHNNHLMSEFYLACKKGDIETVLKIVLDNILIKDITNIVSDYFTF